MEMTGKIKGLGGLLLYPPYILYRGGVFLKNSSFSLGLDKPSEIEAHVISAGGISFGGSGKTPMTIHLAETAQQINKIPRKTAVVSRGYGRSSQGSVIVSDGRNILSHPAEAGDELYVLAKRAPSTVVIADENRVRGAEFAVRSFGCETVILDDCFQHRYIGRNIDLVMLEPEIILHPNRYFLRENPTALKRAGYVVILDTDVTRRDKISRKLAKYTDTPVFWGWRIPRRFVSLKDNSVISDEELKYRKTAAFCAIANPGRFAATLNDLGIFPEGLLAFPDHCKYGPRDLDKISRHFAASGAEMILTTEKDSVKLPGLLNTLPIYYLTIGLEIENESDLMDKLLR